MQIEHPVDSYYKQFAQEFKLKLKNVKDFILFSNLL